MYINALRNITIADTCIYRGKIKRCCIMKKRKESFYIALRLTYYTIINYVCTLKIKVITSKLITL